MGDAKDYETIRKDIVKLLHKPEYDDGSTGPVLVRLAWHSAGTYDAETNTGGSNGAGMRFEAEGGDPANAGLEHARAFLEPVKAAHPWITYADLWTLAGVVAIENMGGPSIPWRGGRIDHVDDSKLPPRGRLPDATKGAEHLRSIFYRMGFNDQEIVALSGAHNLGRCHRDRSGFEGAWVNNPTKFSNQYFRLLLSLQWKKKKLSNGAEQYVNYDDDTEIELMMLPTDITLTQDKSFRKWVELYARDKDRFFKDFTKVFDKLMELGIKRDHNGNIVNIDDKEKGCNSETEKENKSDIISRNLIDRTAIGEAGSLCGHDKEFKTKL
ncbi:putative heme-binding peroxidase [Golovinomyces cichoracearum]|uniref:Peroxidase n=1 Tax=Golovinomyces cichoracearum TaxID=62708 RepID=A0A420J7G7_9PEZI|nr:putative heme-binding peroxidase [Golovinomyces cichoracearum]